MKKNLMGAPFPLFSDEEGWRKGGNTTVTPELGSRSQNYTQGFVSQPSALLCSCRRGFRQQEPSLGNLLVFAETPKRVKKEKSRAPKEP